MWYSLELRLPLASAVVLLVVQARAKGNTDVVDCVECKVPLIEKQTKGAWSAVTQCSNQADAVWVMLFWNNYFLRHPGRRRNWQEAVAAKDSKASMQAGPL